MPGARERVCLREGEHGTRECFGRQRFRSGRELPRREDMPVAVGDHEISLAGPRYEEVTTRVAINAGKNHDSRDDKGNYYSQSRHLAGSAQKAEISSRRVDE
jgi:hypothetical protein